MAWCRNLIQVHINSYTSEFKSLGLAIFCSVFERDVLCSQRTHLFDHKYSAIVILWNNINNSFLLEYIFIMNFKILLWILWQSWIFSSHMILQKLFLYLLLNKQILLLSMLESVVMLNIFVETMIHLFSMMNRKLKRAAFIWKRFFL